MKVVLSDDCLRDLEDIADFLRLTGIPVSLVERILSGLIEEAMALREYPRRGQLEPYLAHRRKGHRRIVRGNYKIVYILARDTVLVIHFFDTRQDPDRLEERLSQE